MFWIRARLQLIVLMWGFTGVVGKLISLSALPLVFYRILIASIVILVVILLMKQSVKVNRKQLLYFLGVGVIIGLHWMMFFGAIKVANVSVALSTLSTGALFTALLEPFFFKRKISVREVIFAAIVMACLLLIFQAQPDYWLGIVLGIICSFLSALFSVFNAILQRDEQNRPRLMMFYEMLGGLAVVTISLFLLGETPQLFDLKTNDLIWLLILGAILTAYPMIESVSLMKHITPFTLLLTVNLEPIYGIVLAYFIFGESEKMSPLFYVAAVIMILVIVGNSLIQLRKRT